MGTLGQRAVTLIEVCVAMAVLSVFVLVASALESQGLRSLQSLRQRQAAQQIASDLQEQIRAGLTPSTGEISIEDRSYHYQVAPLPGGEGYEITVNWNGNREQALSLKRTGVNRAYRAYRK